MRATFYLAAAAVLVFGLITPAPAQMCGGGQQAQAQGGMMGGMCGMGSAAADDPMADKPAQPQQRMAMCPCCRGMAMMRPQQPAQPTPQQHQH